MFQATINADDKGIQMRTQHDNAMEIPIIKQGVINLCDKGLDYTPPLPQSTMTTNHPQINNIEDQPL